MLANMHGAVPQQRKAAMPSPLQPRQRKAVKYSENTPSKTLDDHDNDGSATMESSSSDGSSSSGSDLEPEQVRLTPAENSSMPSFIRLKEDCEY